MDDRFLNQLRRDPRPEFTRSLSERLRRAASSRPEPVVASDGLGFRPAFAAVGALAVVVVALAMFPSVRASAQAFLSLFRVRNFATVPINRDRIEQLEKLGSGPLDLLGTSSVTRSGDGTGYGTANEAFANAGWIGKEPAHIPNGMAADSAFVTPETSIDARLDATKANGTFAALGIGDLSLPPELNGAQIAVRVPRAVGVRYTKGKQRAMFLQSPQPQISMPPGVDMARLGEIGLRIAGLDAAEAKRFAATVDWTSTLLVPVPPNTTVIREVEVGGRKGLLVEADVRDVRPGGKANRGYEGNRSTVLWSDDERVYAITGNVSSESVVSMANSVR